MVGETNRRLENVQCTAKLRKGYNKDEIVCFGEFFVCFGD